MQIILNQAELDALWQPIVGTGGFQTLLRRLRRKCDRPNGRLALSPRDMEQIPRYAFDYANGGWQGRLMATLGRTLGPNLGR